MNGVGRGSRAAHLKLAVSIQAQPSLTTQGVLGSRSEVQGTILSGSRTPLSRANCSRHIGRKRVRETTAKTSLPRGISVRCPWTLKGPVHSVPSECVAQPAPELPSVVFGVVNEVGHDEASVAGAVIERMSVPCTVGIGAVVVAEEEK